ncbi:mannosyl-oligosaccharide alpha-1,2-mannosidase, partial [Acrasis kona]
KDTNRNRKWRRIRRIYKILRSRIYSLISTFKSAEPILLNPLGTGSFQQRHRYQQKLQMQQKLRRIAFSGFVLSSLCLIIVLSIFFFFGWLLSSAERVLEVVRQLEGGDRAFHRDHKTEFRRGAVKDAFVHAWTGYEIHAFGHDEIRPTSNITNDSWGGWGVTIVDSLDTIIIMDLKHLLPRCEDHVSKINFVSEKFISVFETSIRYLGGLISAYDLSGNILYLNKAKELSKLMLPAFDSESGLPFHEIITKTGVAGNAAWMQGASILSEVGSVQLEFKRLARLTNDKELYQKMSDQIILLRDQQLKAKGLPKGLYPVKIKIENGAFDVSSKVTIGGLGDSFYEYLLKQHLMDPTETVFLKMYLESVDAMIENLSFTFNGNHTFITEYQNNKQQYLFEHLTCFAPGMIALGTKHVKNNDLYPKEKRTSHLVFADNVLSTCVMLYDVQPSGIAADTVKFEDGSLEFTNSAYYLRPETIESLFYFFRITGDDKYREAGWRIFENIVKYCRTDSSFSGLKDVTKKPFEKNNSMQSFFFAETLKYLYLLFSGPDVIPLDKYVFNTEGHPFLLK